MQLKATSHAGIVKKNLLAALNKNAKTVEYNSGKEAILITRGPVRSSLPHFRLLRLDLLLPFARTCSLTSTRF